MTTVAAAVVGAGVIGAVGSNMAADKQSSAQDQAAATQQGMFNTVTANSQPYMNTGAGATSTLSQLMGLSGTPGSTVGGTGLNNGYLASTFNPTQDQLDNYPGYQFALKTGGQALTNAQTPSAGALSGSTLKSLMDFNQGAANTNYSTYFNQDQTQKNNIYNRLSQIAGLGQSAAAGVGNSGTQLGTGIAQAQAGAGASQAGGIVGTTNSLSNGATLAALMGGGTGTLAQSTAPDGSAGGGFASGITQMPTAGGS